MSEIGEPGLEKTEAAFSGIELLLNRVGDGEELRLVAGRPWPPLPQK